MNSPLHLLPFTAVQWDRIDRDFDAKRIVDEIGDVLDVSHEITLTRAPGLMLFGEKNGKRLKITVSVEDA